MRRRSSPFNLTVLTLGFAFLYLPILLLVVYSFNESRLVTVWAGFSTKWYGEMVANDALIAAAWMIVSGYTSINAVVKAELFPTNVRAIGVGLPYALTVSIFGGTADSVALWFKSVGHEGWYYYYLTGMIGISLVVYLFMRDTKADSAMHRHE